MENIKDKYEVVIGLEIHAQLDTNTKQYSSDKNEYGGMPNTHVSVVSLGHPGTLPKLNKKSIEYAVKMGLAIGSEITHEMHFDRKNYYYPDLPKGYQITQDLTPICTGGQIVVKTTEGENKVIKITRIHLEEDAGKSIHDLDPKNSLVDLNRAGTPLIEIVSEPDLRSSTEAYNYVTEVRKLVRYLEICDGNMEEGSLRCDANISIMPKGSTVFGDRVEVKNMNSIRNVQRAIDHEVERQIEIVERGDKVVQDTRNFDAATGTTTSMRKKEGAHDYRFFPEPDLQPILVTDDYIEKVRAALPPLPSELFNKYVNEYGLSEYDAGNITDNKFIALYYEALTSYTKNYKSAANWLMGEIKSYINQTATTIESFPITPQNIAALIALIDEGKITNNIASKKVFPEMLKDASSSPIAIAEKNNWLTEDKGTEIEGIVKEIMAKFPDKVEAYRGGNKKLLGMFMGEVMRGTKGKADPKQAGDIVKKLLETE